jgi:hypothetical protein
LISEEATLLGWARAIAPQWIVGFACSGSSGAPLPNAPNSGQQNQLFTGMNLNPSSGGNFMLEFHDGLKCFTDGNATPPSLPDGRNTTYGFAGDTPVGGNTKAYPGYPPSTLSVTRPECVSNRAHWVAAPAYYCQQANCPLFISESNWNPVVQTGATAQAPDFGALAQVVDKFASYNGMNPQPAMISFWDWGTSQTDDAFSLQPGVAPGNTGVNFDGWTYYADAVFNNWLGAVRVLQDNNTWYRFT